jgi:predicted nucleotidyltransferase
VDSKRFTVWLQSIVEKIRREYQPDRVVLFGSYAYGQPNEDSDVDLLVIKQTTERPIDRRVAVARIISDPNATIPVEVIVLTPDELQQRLRIGDQFLLEVAERGRTLYAA